MKTIVSIFLCVSVCFTSCDKNQENNSPHPPVGPMILDLLFVDESGDFLVKNLPLIPIPNYDSDYAHVDMASYRLNVTVNGLENDEKELWPCEASLVSGRFHFITNANMVGGPNYDETPDAIYVYKIVFYCPAIYGNESEHTFVLERKRRYYGWTNNAERLFYDGNLIASGVEGARPPGPSEPFVIVVPQK